MLLKMCQDIQHKTYSILLSTEKLKESLVQQEKKVLAEKPESGWIVGK